MFIFEYASETALVGLLSYGLFAVVNDQAALGWFIALAMWVLMFFAFIKTAYPKKLIDNEAESA